MPHHATPSDGLINGDQRAQKSSDVWAALGHFIRTCEIGRPDGYWWMQARYLARMDAELRAEFADVWDRALDWADAAHAAHKAAAAGDHDGGSVRSANQHRDSRSVHGQPGDAKGGGSC